MKVFHNIYDELISFENLYNAWRDFRSGKADKKEVIVFKHKLEDNIFSLKADLENLNYRHGSYERFLVHDPKLRIIHKAGVRDRIVHTLAARKLEEIYQGVFIADSFACQKGKGTHAALYALQKMCRKQSRNYTKNFWYLKCDVKKFFDNVSHDVLLKTLGKRIKDKKFLWLLNSIIGSFYKDKPAVGLPLGNFTSQWFANIYLNELDQFVKQDLRIKKYVRYADDFVILNDDKDFLLKVLTVVSDFVNAKLALAMHPRKVIVGKFSQGIDWVGYKILSRYVILRKQTRKIMFRNIYDRSRCFGRAEIGLRALHQSVNSYLGLLKHCAGRGTADKVRFEFFSAEALQTTQLW